jgi:phenylalanyl-tRNA synthetase beta subunit
MNIKAGFDEFALFELGKIHNKLVKGEDKLPKEINSLSLVYASKNKTKGAAYFRARRYLDSLLEDFQVSKTVNLVPLDKADLYKNDVLVQQSKSFDPKRSVALVDDQKLVWGFAGEYRKSVKLALKLPESVAGLEIDPLLFLHRVEQGSPYQPLSRFPSTNQDITFKLPADVTYAELGTVVETALQTAAKQHGYVTKLGLLDIYQKDKANKHFSFRITLTHHDRTLVTEEVNKLLDEIASAAKTKLKAVRL